MDDNATDNVHTIEEAAGILNVLPEHIENAIKEGIFIDVSPDGKLISSKEIDYRLGCCIY